MINIQQALQLATTQLQQFVQPALEAEYLLAAVVNKSRAYLRAFAEQELTVAEEKIFRANLVRRIAGEPLAYITGHKEFWNLNLIVSPAVLIPRPETELLIAEALRLLSVDQVYQVADLGTGSGAIGLALAHERPKWQIVATDNDPAALKIAVQNAQQHNLTNVSFYLGDWCAALPAAKFDLIISNPPYIAADDPQLEPQVRQFEPTIALIAADNGLAHIKKIAEQARNFLKSDGYLILEHGAQQQIAVQKILLTADYEIIKTCTDLAGLPRGIVAR